jgi:hypothetical protein
MGQWYRKRYSGLCVVNLCTKCSDASVACKRVQVALAIRTSTGGDADRQNEGGASTSVVRVEVRWNQMDA